MGIRIVLSTIVPGNDILWFSERWKVLQSVSVVNYTAHITFLTYNAWMNQEEKTKQVIGNHEKLVFMEQKKNEKKFLS